MVPIEISALLTPELILLAFTIVGAITTTVLERRKDGVKRRLREAGTTIDLARETLKQIEARSDSVNDRYHELFNRHESLLDRVDKLQDELDRVKSQYYEQLERITVQESHIARLKYEILKYKDSITIEDVDDLFPI